MPIRSPREKVHCVAARMLRSRIEMVVELLPKVLADVGTNSEDIHQLRVWSRRSEAAVALCKKLIARRQRKRLMHRLRSLRRAAGRIRDLDVRIGRLEERKDSLAKEYLLDQARSERDSAVPPLLALGAHLREGRRLSFQLREICKRLKRRRKRRASRKSIRSWVRRRMKPLLAEFARRSDSDCHDLDALHRFRVAGKRLRYALELVGRLYKKADRKRFDARLSDLQSRLGTINDLRTLVALLEREQQATSKRALRAQLGRLITQERRRLTNACSDFGQYWTKQRATRFLQRWHEAL